MKRKRGRPKKTVVKDPIPPPSFSAPPPPPPPPPPPAPVTADDEAIFLNFVGQNVDENQFENENEYSESVELNRNDDINDDVDGNFVQFNTEREFSSSPGLPSSASDGDEEDESDDSESSLSLSEEPVPRKRVKTVANKYSRSKKFVDTDNVNINVDAAVAASTVRGGSVAGIGLSSTVMSARGGGGALSSLSWRQLSQIGKRPTQDPRYDTKSLETALLVIKKVMKMDEALSFNYPVDPVAQGIPDYFRVVVAPMDFGTICSNLENCVKYMNSDDVYKDVEHIWGNCLKFNKRGDYTMYLMKVVKKKFMKYWKAAGLRSEIPMNRTGLPHIPEPPNMLHNMERQNYAPKHPVAPMGNGSAHSHKQPQPSSQLRQSEWSMRRPQPSWLNIGGDTNNADLTCQSRKWRFHPMDGLTTHVPGSSMDTSLSSMNRQHVPKHGQPNERHPPQVTTAQHQSRIAPRLSQPLGSANIFSSGMQQSDADRREKRQMQMHSADPGADVALLPGSSLSQQPLAKHSQVYKVKPSALVKKRRIESSRLLGDLQDGERIHVPINKLGQPVGPEAAKLASFLGILARDCYIAPLNYLNWHSMPEANKEHMWQSVQTRFDIDPNCKKWVMKSIVSKWRDWKRKLKADHYNPHKTDEERLRDFNEQVHPDQWAALVAYWNTEKIKILCAKNSARRAMQKTSHATGSKSFARLREEEQAKRPDGKELTRAELYILTRTRKDGNPVDETAAEMISKLREAKNQQNSDGSNGYADTFCQVMGEKPSQVGPSPHEGQKPSLDSLMTMAISTNEEVKKMTNRMEAMEQKYASLEAQIATMLSCVQSLIDKKDALSSKQVSNHDPKDSFESQEQYSSSSHAMED